jgi:hypothetical protein
MIKHIIDLLEVSDWYGISHNIDVAKGMYKAPKDWQETVSVVKRIKESKAYTNG